MKIRLNDSWSFHKGDIKVEKPLLKGPVYAQAKTERRLVGPASYAYNDLGDSYYTASLTHEKWELVDIPHDYVVLQDLSINGNNAHGYLKYDNAWYRKRFTLPENCEDKRITLQFDGIAGESTIYVNGCLAKRNFSSYNTFLIDISEYVFFDKENVIAVYVNTEEYEGWWYQGGGIYRNVYLNITNKIAIDLWGVYAPYKKINDTDWLVNFETTVINTSFDASDVTVESFVLDENGNTVAKAEGCGRVGLRDKSTIKYQATVKNPLLWDCENPNLYTIKTNLKIDNIVVDENITRIGFRTVEVSAEKGLLINGKKTIIKGVCSHQDFGLTGLAVPDNVARHKISLIKEMGANGYRTSHYMQNESYMDALDEMGMLVMDENRWFSTNEETYAQVEALVKRDRNRPSVIFWSTSNEEPLHIEERGMKLHRVLKEYIRKFDDTRLIVAAESDYPEDSTVYEFSDVLGINYCLNSYDEVHRKHPDKAVIASECCATGSTRDWNFPTNSNGRIRDKDADTSNWFLGREKTWKFLMGKPYVIGCYQWDAFEHRGEATWPRMCSVAGAMDIFLQKKGGFYINKALWTEEPMVHIVPHWNFKGLEGENILVTVYTNCDELELFLNGESLGSKQIEKYGHGEWQVLYAPGELLVKGYRNGEMVCKDKKITTGEPKSLRLTLENEFEANNHDLALFTCECLDENGNVVPDAEELVEFYVSSPAKIVGTGSDNTDHKNVASNIRKMYMGKISVAVRPDMSNPDFELMAKSKNCGICIYKSF